MKQEEEEQGETFDVIITKINTGGSEDGDEEKDRGGMVDNCTQTPRDEDSNKDKEVKVEVEETTGLADSVHQDNKQGEDGGEAEESGADKYDDEDLKKALRRTWRKRAKRRRKLIKKMMRLK
ncbi:hypothetical protein OS493_007909 [Desmophyllum pertusum]|uniref:Uncharacterized protein n=1 Tax=Desmophyllum pertusum TaxID=174260 RepID=A0A9X0CG88_9CNID|nr:hypothetical protein OS493_007909 [Desmophyllum pertusum]